MKHGTNSCYVHNKCHCSKCKKAHAKANLLRNKQVQQDLAKLGYKQRWVIFTSIGVDVLNACKPDNFTSFYNQQFIEGQSSSVYGAGDASPANQTKQT